MAVERGRSGVLVVTILAAAFACLSSISAASELAQLPNLVPTPIDADLSGLPASEKAELKLRVTRISPDFKEKVNVIPLSFPGNFQLGNTEIPANVTEISVSIPVQKGTRPGLYTLTALGQAQVPYSKNPQDASKPNTLVAMPSRPVTVEVK